MTQRSWLVAGLVGLTLAAAGPIAAQTVPAGYPAAYKDVVAGAQKEGKLVVYATTDSASAEPLLKDFKSLFPFLSVEYNDLNSTELYNRYIGEVAAAAGTGDLLWSSAMDLQMKLVADKNALVYGSPEAQQLPSWAVFENQAYGTTFEPLVIVYNKRLLPADAVPKSHADLARLITEKPDLFKGKVTCYDTEKSGVGFLLTTQDAAAWPQYWDLVRAFGKSGAKYYTSAGAMMEKVTSGEHLVAYNIFGSYALLRQKKDPNLAFVNPSDFTLGLSRVAFISKTARHPNAAKLFLDYLLSKRGQDILANQSLLYAVREDVTGPATAAALKKELGDKLRPIPVDASLLQYLEQGKRLEVLGKWKQSIRG
jgi:iron(III) transport system substrate-binding protein